MVKSVCVYCSSSGHIDDVYFADARAMGEALAKRGLGLVYGGGNIGLMGALAQAAHVHGGHTVAVIPQALHDRGLTFENADEVVITRNMRERKQEMERRSHGFVALPGGYGTYEEFFEMLTLKQLEYHAKPIVLLNTADFFAPLVHLVDDLIAKGFVKADHRELFYVAEDVEDALTYLETYKAEPHNSKFG
jgi:cytokinin riboside 5'-monophosphate phosphoribohydrolase